ncbi:MAG: glycosyltransferase family protein [Myxococcaceae bacterium]
MNGRILYLAIADGRGHLMRATILRKLLIQHGIRVDIVTTSGEGVRFVEQMGHPCELLSTALELEFDDRHCLDVRRTRARMIRYLLPSRLGRDLRRLEKMAEGADLVVNDSMHLALLFAAAWRPRMHVVQVVGENIFRTSTEKVNAEGSAALRNMGAGLVSSAFKRSFARIFHSLEPGPSTDRTFRLPPVIRSPERTIQQVRTEHGDRIAAVYLNPHYSNVAIADAIERAVAQRGLRLYGVSEAFANRPGWRAADPHFVDVVSASEVLISGAGMGALEQSRVFGVPLIALLGDQPEQTENVKQRGCASVSARSPRLAEELGFALGGLAHGASSPSQIQAIHSAWTSAFVALINAARTESTHGHGLAGHRNGESERRSGAR